MGSLNPPFSSPLSPAVLAMVAAAEAALDTAEMSRRRYVFEAVVPFVIPVSVGSRR
ncbi:hypothetical protein Lalb_Chr01g0022141 [Lupinus albus]|uniref:Uncharacterized protein n=1 Tax=Lupinus albus TaxID=3870 RepID=A0A6A4R858_LUPAL|nr:hypothetical protein Lalb_Chr01g0022141 [Lupinus albus]